MKIGVCIKLVPSIEGQVALKSPEAGVDEGSKIILNPYDENAVEEAVLLKEAGLASEVISYTVSGRQKVDRTLRTVLAKGADKSIHILDAELDAGDALGVARALANAMKKDEVGMILCGKLAIDTDAGQLPAMIAECMDWPIVTAISKLEIADGAFTASRDIGGGNKAIVKGTLPAVFSCDKVLNNPRFVKFKERKAAKKKPLEEISASDVDGQVSTVVTNTNWHLPQKKSECRFIEGDTKAAVQELLQLLREEAKVL